MKSSSFGVLILFASFAPALAAEQTKKPVTVSDLKAELLSNDWPKRQRALRLVSQIPGTQSEKVWDTLIATLERENLIVRNGVNRGDEGYSEYYSNLLQAILISMTPEMLTPKSASVLVKSIYNPDSKFAELLGRAGRVMVTPALNCTSSSDDHLRSRCFAIAGWILAADNKAKDDAKIKASERDLLLRTIRTEVIGGQYDISRIWAVRALANAEDTLSISMLERIEITEQGRPGPRSYLLTVVGEALGRLRAIK